MPVLLTQAAASRAHITKVAVFIGPYPIPSDSS
jgi:hypothetical protein